MRWLVEEQGADPLWMGPPGTGAVMRPSGLARAAGHAAVEAYLLEQEEKAEAARAEWEAAARRVAGAGAGRGGGIVVEDDFDDGAMDFGDMVGLDAAAAVSDTLAGLTLEQQEAQPQQPLPQSELDETKGAAAAAGIPTPAAASSPPPVALDQPPPPLAEFLEAHTPESLLCPITLELLDDPVVLVADGCTYSRAAIERHLDHCRARKCIGVVIVPFGSRHVAPLSF